MADKPTPAQEIAGSMQQIQNCGYKLRDGDYRDHLNFALAHNSSWTKIIELAEGELAECAGRIQPPAGEDPAPELCNNKDWNRMVEIVTEMLG